MTKKLPHEVKIFNKVQKKKLGQTSLLTKIICTHFFNDKCKQKKTALHRISKETKERIQIKPTVSIEAGIARTVRGTYAMIL